ncbi:cupredoxin domain-containing protein [Paraburkholderia tagetis]|uniref:Cupredoxin family copper-binding protein n=1 Tax=Paraburkholderia tagetis TaxID=2913261 RepID=A0A9X1RPC1_9BURK|nr:cupredoxin family copper-binding protein [Paraburkholderia tagetis]MCG5075088.1 cupredoxin family copper-binding protein [Paraburkholderia tagetis]
MSRLPHILLARSGICAIVLAAAAGPAAASDHVVTIEQMRFSPPTVKVHSGDTIVWVNKDLVAHTASAQASTFDSGSIAPGASWRYVASKPGSYAYQCLFHPTMHGTLIVEPKP